MQHTVKLMTRQGSLSCNLKLQLVEYHDILFCHTKQEFAFSPQNHTLQDCTEVTLLSCFLCTILVTFTKKQSVKSISTEGKIETAMFIELLIYLPPKPGRCLSNLYVGGNLITASRIPWKTFPFFISSLSWSFSLSQSKHL